MSSSQSSTARGRAAEALAAHTELRGRLVVATGRVDQNVERLAVDGACRVVAKPCSVDDVTALLNAR